MRPTIIIPDKGPKNTAYAEIAEMKEFAVYKMVRLLGFDNVDEDTGSTYIQNLPRVDADANDRDNEGSSSNVDVPWKKPIRPMENKWEILERTHRGSNAAKSMPPTTPQATTYGKCPSDDQIRPNMLEAFNLH